MKRISTPLEPTPFNLCSDGYTALALAIYGNSYLSPQEAAKTSEVCKTFKEIGETSDQALNYWKWQTCDHFDVNKNDYENTIKVWKDLFVSKNNEILKTLQDEILLYAFGADEDDLEDYQNFINLIKPIEKYSLKTNANTSLQLVIADFYKSAWICLEKNCDVDYEIMAKRYFKLAADQGSVDAQYKLGEIYYDYYHDGDLEDYRANGNSDEQYFSDLKKAFEYYEKAACQGNPEALDQIIKSYEFGKDFLTNPETIFNFFKNKANVFNESNQNYYVRGNEYNFGTAACYEIGIGVKKNMEEAIRYYKIAAAKDCDQSLSKVALLCNIDRETINNYRDFYFNFYFDHIFNKPFESLHLTPEECFKLAQFCDILGTEFCLQVAKITYTKAIDYCKTIISSPLLHNNQPINENVSVINHITDTWYASKEEELLQKAVWHEKEKNLKEAAVYYKRLAELLVTGK